MAVEYRKSPLQALLEELPTIIASDRKQKADQAYQTQTLLLQNSLAERRELIKDYQLNIQKMSSIGATADMLKGVSSENATNPINTEKILNSNLEELTDIHQDYTESNNELVKMINNQYVNMASFEAGQKLKLELGGRNIYEIPKGELGAGVIDSFENNDWFRLGATSMTPEYLTAAYKASQTPGTTQYDRALESEMTTRGAIKQQDIAITKESIQQSFVNQSSSLNMPTVFSDVNKLNFNEKYSEYNRSFGILQEYNMMSPEEIEAIVDLGVAQGVPDLGEIQGAMEHSELAAFEAGLAVKFDEWAIENKIFPNQEGYENAKENYIQMAIQGLQGKTLVNPSNANIMKMQRNPYYNTLSTPSAVASYKVGIEEDLYKTKKGQSLIAEKNKLLNAVQSRLFVNIKQGEVSDVAKKEFRKTFDNKKDYNEALNLVRGEQSLDQLEMYYKTNKNVKKLIDLATDGKFNAMTRVINKQIDDYMEIYKEDPQVPTETDRYDILNKYGLGPG